MSGKSKNPTIRERLAELETKMDYLIKGFDNHLNTHKTYTYLSFSTAMGMIVALVLIVVKLY